MLQLANKLNQRKRRGNLLVITLMSAIVVAMLCGIVIKAGNNLASATSKSKTITDVYNGLAFADIFADAFFADVSSQYNQEVIDVGTLEFTTEFYTDMISGTDGFAENMNIELQADGTYLYTGNAEAVAESITFADTATTLMETQFGRLAEEIDTFTITLDSVFVPDDSAAGNILEGKNGDRYYLKDIEFTLRFNLGIEKYMQKYRISGLYSEFSIGEGVITCTIKKDEAKMQLLTQKIG